MIKSDLMYVADQIADLRNFLFSHPTACILEALAQEYDHYSDFSGEVNPEEVQHNKEMARRLRSIIKIENPEFQSRLEEIEQIRIDRMMAL